MDDGRNPLNQAYAYVAAGSPMKALAVVLGILRQQFGGDEARVFEFIQEARATFRREQQSEEELEYAQLVAQLQEMSLSQAHNDARAAAEQAVAAEALLQQLIAKESFLGQAGREQIMVDAHSDGSSIVCTLCHELIAAARWEQHVRFWCPARPHAATSSDDDDDGIDSHGCNPPQSSPLPPPYLFLQQQQQPHA